ncbi:hypothetical protein P8C59_003886 [Phyllachora maydis]|uniref:Uncharacterized protein n=1 Tax=Phyllachora maydis TaxID=1825666 RepID=A0AAD9I2A1_9PEZI|nr:hypothetical protein P8C59_003886 [Phyllachora maydis]
MSKHREPQSQIGIPTAPLALASTPAKPAKITPAIRRTAACKAKQRKYTTNSSLIANKDNNNAYNGVYIPPAKAEEEEEKEGSSGDNNSVNSSTSDSADKGKGGGMRERGDGASRYKDTLLYKQ